MPKAQPYVGPLDDKTAVQFLNSSGVKVGEIGLGELLVQRSLALKEAITKANEFLEGSELAKALAEHLAAKMNRRGSASLSVSETGEVQLHIEYGEETPVQKPKKLPLLRELRAEAKKMGVDVSEFGIKRREIWSYLRTIKAQKNPPSESDYIPSVKPDETKISAALEEIRPPKRRNFPKPAESVVIVDSLPEELAPPPKIAPKAHLRQLVQEAEAVDISALLLSDPPKQ